MERYNEQKPPEIPKEALMVNEITGQASGWESGELDGAIMSQTDAGHPSVESGAPEPGPNQHEPVRDVRDDPIESDRRHVVTSKLSRIVPFDGPFVPHKPSGQWVRLPKNFHD